MTRAEWLAARLELVTASDCAAILEIPGVTIDKYRTRAEVFAEKTGQAPPQEESEAMRWGTRLQVTILNGWLEDFVAQAPEIAETVGADPYEIRVHPAKPWLGATLDGYYQTADHTIPVEVKSVNFFAGKEWDAGAPLRYQIQLAIQCYVLDAPVGWLVGLIGGQRLVAHKLACPREFLEVIALPQLEKFHREVIEFRAERKLFPAKEETG